METFQLLIIITLLAILAEVTYLIVKLPRQNLSRKQSRPILVDTSVLIDGRIIAVAKSGFIGDTLVIPRSVIGELQFLADNADHDKRARARYGLDVVSDLQSIPQVAVEILQDGSKAQEGVDERLLTLAKKHHAAVCTIDYNLNKVAVVEGITVLNVNELAQTLRMAYLPGEKMLLELVQKGQDSHQGVGYLTDGTMVVVEQSSKYIGQTVEVEFIRSLQTAAGKMMFAKRVEKDAVQATRSQKPIGKKPYKAPEAAPSVAKSSVAVPKKPSVYHSERSSHGNKGKKPHASSVDTHTSGNANRQQTSKKKPRTSAEREASFIDLLGKQ